MKKTKGMILGMALALMAPTINAEMSAVSADTPLDTRSLSAVTNLADEEMDTRTHKGASWSDSKWTRARTKGRAGATRHGRAD